MGPAGADQGEGLDRAGEAAEQERGLLLLGAQQQHLADVGVRRPRLGQEVVAVVPERDQPEVVDRRERGGAGAEHDPAAAAGHGEEVAVAGGRAGVGGERHVVALAQDGGERGVDPGDVAVVGHDQQRPAPAGPGVGGGVGEGGGPVGGRRRRPDRARRPPGGEVGEERLGRLVTRPGHGGGLGVERGGGVGLGRRFGLGGRVAGRHGQPEHVGPAAGVPLGDGGGERHDLGREDRLGAHDPPQRRQPAGVLGLGDPLDDVAVDVLAREPHLHPRPRHRGVGVLGRDEVVEGAVEVGQRHVDQHPRDRVDGGRLHVRGLPRPGRRRLRLRVGHRGAEAGQHLGLSVGHGCCLPAAADGRDFLSESLCSRAIQRPETRWFPGYPGNQQRALRPPQQPSGRRRGRCAPR